MEVKILNVTTLPRQGRERPEFFKPNHVQSCGNHTEVRKLNRPEVVPGVQAMYVQEARVPGGIWATKGATHDHLHGCNAITPCNTITISHVPLLYHHITKKSLAGEDTGAGDLVVLDRGPVDADFDSGVGALVSAREADGVRGRLAAGAANDCSKECQPTIRSTLPRPATGMG